MIHDVIVVGAGPAGATAAFELARAGLRVLVLERERLPRAKPCAGVLSPKVLPLLPLDPRPLIEGEIRGAIVTLRGREGHRIVADKPVAHTVRRDRFDYALVGRAAEAGAKVEDGMRVAGIQVFWDHVQVWVGGQGYSCRTLVGADGAAGIVARAVDPAPRPAAIAMSAELPMEAAPPGAADVARLDFGRVPRGYAWIFPKGDRVAVGIASGGRSASALGKALRAYLSEQLPGGVAGRLRLVGHRIPQYTPRPLSAQRVVLVGDAAGLVDPFMGEGIYYAIRSAQMASRAILAGWGDPDHRLIEHDWQVRKAFHEEFTAAGWLAELVYRLPGLWHRALREDPGLATDYFALLAGAGSYRAIARRLLAAARALLGRPTPRPGAAIGGARGEEVIAFAGGSPA